MKPTSRYHVTTVFIQPVITASELQQSLDTRTELQQLLDTRTELQQSLDTRTELEQSLDTWTVLQQSLDTLNGRTKPVTTEHALPVTPVKLNTQLVIGTVNSTIITSIISYLEPRRMITQTSYIGCFSYFGLLYHGGPI